MNDDNNNNENKPSWLVQQHMALMQDKSIEKKNNIRKLEQLTPGSQWTIVQDLVQEIQADYISRTIPIPPAKAILEELVEKVERNYEEEPEKKEIILKGMPSKTSILYWYKLEGWNKAVWDKVKNDTLFSKARRSAMIDALYKRGLEKDTVAAKLYLTMSGDYSDRPPDEKNSTIEAFKDINKILHKKA
jgi:hypothetical protein